MADFNYSAKAAIINSNNKLLSPDKTC